MGAQKHTSIDDRRPNDFVNDSHVWFLAWPEREATFSGI